MTSMTNLFAGRRAEYAIFPSSPRHFGSPAVKVPTKPAFLAFCGNIDKPAGPRQPRPGGHVCCCCCCFPGSCEPGCQIEAATIMKSNWLGWLIAWVFTAAPKLRPPAAMPPTTPGSAREGSRGLTRSSQRHWQRPPACRARIDPRWRPAPGPPFVAIVLRSLAGHGRYCRHGNPGGPKSGTVPLDESLHVVFRLFRPPRRNRPGCRESRPWRALTSRVRNSRSSWAMTIPRNFGWPSRWPGLQVQASRVHGDIAIGITSGSADDSHMDGKAFVEQIMVSPSTSIRRTISVVVRALTCRHRSGDRRMYPARPREGSRLAAAISRKDG